jgi:hypothetical protein
VQADPKVIEAYLGGAAADEALPSDMQTNLPSPGATASLT